MGDEGAALLAQVFSQGWSLVNIFQYYFSPPTLPRLHSILLYGNDITSTGANTLLSAFKYLPQVELLGLEFLRNFQNRRLIARSSIVLERSGNLQSHAVGSHALHFHVAGSRESESGRQLFGAVLRIYGLLNHWRCDHHSKTVLESYCYADNPSVDNRFKSRGVMKLASLMADRKLPNLEILNLENNEIDEESTHFLSCSITSETVPNLQEFLIGGNPIGDKGVTHLFRYFRKNKVNFIKRLCLNGLRLVEGMLCRDSDGV